MPTMKSPIIAAVLLILSGPAFAGMRHDRLCDKVQDKFSRYDRIYNPDHAHYVRFGKCPGPVIAAPDDTPESFVSLGAYWGSVNCGYQAYREGKKLTASPYKNLEKTAAWKAGWGYARQSCTTGRLPTFD